jgi:TRAP transporter 4TM/12TM fusion protein
MGMARSPRRGNPIARAKLKEKSMPQGQNVLNGGETLKGFDRLGPISRVVFLIVFMGGIAFSINEIFLLGIVYHEFVYFYGILAIFLSASFIIFPATKGAPRDRIPWYDILLALATVAGCAYMMIHAYEISYEGWVYTGPPSSTVASILLWGIALEGLRRVGGLALFVFAALFSFYPLFALHMPGFLEGTGWSFPGAAMFHAMTRESIIGIPTRIFSTLVIGFMIFGVTLQETGGAQFFLDFAFALFGKVRGGPAKVSVVSSALFGSMSGSAISNVVTTGAMTIPTMKRTGYPGYYAGAVEACSSSGGVVMPPVMGAVAFIMASFLMVPYASVVIAAIVPSLLYFFGLFVQIDGFAAKSGLAGLPKSELPSLKETLKSGWIYVSAIAVLIYLLFYLRQEAQAPYYASAMLLVAACCRKETRPNLTTLYIIIMRSGRLVAEMLAVMAGIGLIIGGLSMTGVAVSFSSELVNAVGDKALLLLIVGAVASFILGMGMTISACYIFLAIVLVPALIPAGFDVMAVHFFVMYCGLWSFITPPVALGSYVAAGIAGANSWHTGVASMKLGFVKYFIPFFFVYEPALLLHGKDVLLILQSVATAFLGVFLLGSSIEGYIIGLKRLGIIPRALFFCSGLVLFLPGGLTDIAGILVGLAAAVITLLYRSAQTRAAAARERA